MIHERDAVTNESSRANQGEKFRAMTSSNASRIRILVADDQPDIREALRLLLKGEGFETETVASPAAVFRTTKSEQR